MNEESDTDLTKLEPLSPWETFTEFWEKDKNLSREAWKIFFSSSSLAESWINSRSSWINTEEWV